METVGPPLDDVELHLLTEWGDPTSRGRSGVAGVASVLVHVAGIILILLLPSDFLSSPPEPVKARHVITPLIEPLKLQFDAFLDSLATRSLPKSSGVAARRTLAAALAILDKIKEHSEIVSRTIG